MKQNLKHFKKFLTKENFICLSENCRSKVQE